MNPAKIRLSTDELLLVKNAQWILTKNKILQKAHELLGSLSEGMKDKLLLDQLPGTVALSTPKISKGENYRGLPYLVLDYPRLFTKENVFAVRTLFWWANYFSITLHLKGEYKSEFLGAVLKKLPLLTGRNFYISTSGDEWQHDLNSQNYFLLTDLDECLLQMHLMQSSFFKLAAKVELDHWDEAENSLLALFGLLMNSVKN